MTKTFVQKIHCKNFKGFGERKIEGLDSNLNIFIGDNETGKSSMLLAIELVLSANPSRVDAIGLDKLLNRQAVDEFLKKAGRTFADLPVMAIDLYLGNCASEEMDGQSNLENAAGFGLYLRCRPRDDLRDVINEIVSGDNPTFPFEYYLAEIKGFSGRSITPYNKPLRHLLIDNTRISNEHASRAYIQKMYEAYAKDEEKQRLKFEYRQMNGSFARESFGDLNKRVDGDYEFAVRSGSKANLETDLTLEANGVDLENMGVGKQCFVRAEFALSKQTQIDLVLLEEPENHLSHERMKRLVRIIQDAKESQVFVATHSSLICSRLDLRKAVFFGDPSANPIKLDAISEETARFFMKAPNSAVLELALANRVLLVEGNAEYMLMESFYKALTDESLFGSGLSVISVGGLSFPRFLEIANLLGIKTAVITDNDGNHQRTCVERYEAFAESDAIQIFFDPDDGRTTFEVCLYRDNTGVCDELFAKGRKTLTVEQYMLSNKAEAAFQLANEVGEKLSPPEYVKNAITWLNS